jgi:hypothetical protein
MKDCFVFSNKEAQTGSYQIDNVEYHAHCLSFSEEYNAKFSQQLRERGVDISFDTFKTHNSVLTDNTMDLSISQNAASVKGVYHILRDKDKYQSPSHDSLSTYKSGNLEEIQWDMGGKLTPEFPLKLKDDGITNIYIYVLTKLASLEYVQEPVARLLSRRHQLRFHRGIWGSQWQRCYQFVQGDASASRVRDLGGERQRSLR